MSDLRRKKISGFFVKHPILDKIIIPILIGLLTFVITDVFIPNLNNQKIHNTNNISIVMDSAQTDSANSQTEMINMLRNNVNLERSQTINSLGWALIMFTMALAIVLAIMHFKPAADKQLLIICLAAGWGVIFFFILNVINELGSKIQAWM